MKQTNDKRSTQVCINLVSILAVAAAPVAFAQKPEIAYLEAFETEGRVLYSNQINALKTPTPIIDVPQSLSIMTSDQITQQGFTSIGDIINYTPGVNTSQGEGHRDAVVFRGVRSTADFFIDGVRDDVQYYRPLYNLEQVEILRGPNALLFGRGGTGGILNRVTKKGVFEESFTNYQANVDSFGEFGVQLDTNVAIGDTAAVRLNAMYEDLANDRDFYDGERIGLNPKLRFQVGDSSVYDISYEYIDHERFIDRGIPTGANGLPIESLRDRVFADPELNINTLEAHILRTTVQHEFANNVKGNISAVYKDFDKFYQNFYPSAFDPAANIVTLDGYVDTTQRQSFTLAGNFVGEFETGSLGHRFIVGAEYIDTDNNNDRFNSFFDQSADDTEHFLADETFSLVNGVGINADGNTSTNDFSADLNDDTEAAVQTYSIYIQDEIELSENWDLIVGARFDKFDIEVFDTKAFNERIVNGEDITRADETRDNSDDQISPRLGLVFKPQENVSIYTSYSETFLPQSGEQYANLGSRGLDPDEFTNVELGLKWDFTDGLSFTASIFEIQQDAIEEDGLGGAFTVTSETKGFEAQVIGNVTEQWTLSAGYSFLDGELPNGNTPREVPEHMFSIWNKYQVTEKFGLGLGLTYQDDSFINNGNTATLPSYTRIDAAAFYTVSENLRIQLNVENLTDELYFPNAHSTHQATVGAPINAMLTVVGRF